MGLKNDMKNADLIIIQDDEMVVIKDKYPKARFHYLVVPKKEIPSIVGVTKEDLHLLERMEEIGKKLASVQPHYEFL